MTTCGFCHEAPASVFTPTLPLCKPCRRFLRDQEAFDNPIDNGPTCDACGGVLERNDFCGWCDAQATRAFNERMVRFG